MALVWSRGVELLYDGKVKRIRACFDFTPFLLRLLL